MRLKTEEIEKKEKVLFLYKGQSTVVDQFKKKLEANQFEIFSTDRLPNRFEYFRYIFIFDTSFDLRSIVDKTKSPLFVVVFDDVPGYKKILNFAETDSHSIKIVLVSEDQLTPGSILYKDEHIERILWFLLSSSKEKALNLAPSLKPKKKPHHVPRKARISKKKVILICFSLFLFSQLFFLIPLFISSVYLYKSVNELKQYHMEKAQSYNQTSAPFLSLAKKSYAFAQPVLSFFYISVIPNNIISLEDTSSILISNVIDLNENGRTIASLIFKKSKSDQEIQTTAYRIKNLKIQIQNIQNHLDLLIEKFDYPFKKAEDIRDQLIQGQRALKQLQPMLDESDYLLGSQTERRYLVLFENNMELRPGGGFIGSYATLTMKNYTVTNLDIQDVYTADGQLTGHIDPPDAIRTYLNQPNWFLRDSNFSPDFPENFVKAEYFLEKELKTQSYDGGIAITTTAINNLLGAFGDIYLPDYDEYINKDNFYIKTQTHVEKDFFPGSVQKKSYLSSLTNQLMIHLENDVNKDVLGAFKKSLDEKQIVMFFRNEDLQKSIDQAGWSGKLLAPSCALPIDQCVVDSFFSVDANLGVNKANFFVARYFDIQTRINSQGLISKKALLTYQNDSSYEIFPGGTYKNYLQLLLPRDSQIKLITKNGTKIESYDVQNTDAFQTIGFYFEVAPKSRVVIEIDYDLTQKILAGKNGYQLIVQKQIGSLNNDVKLTFDLPSNVSIDKNNFSALAKDNKLIYNTSLTTDKIFLIELTKK
jgi:hypothetical protein